MIHHRLQFTIGHLLRLIVGSAIVAAVMRIPGAAIALAIMAVLSLCVLPGFMIDRSRGGSGLKGGIVSGALSFVGLGAAWLLFVLLTVTGSNALLVFQAFWYFGTLALIGAICGIIFSIPFYLFFEYVIEKDRAFRGALTDDACGPIQWRGFR